MNNKYYKAVRGRLVYAVGTNYDLVKHYADNRCLAVAEVSKRDYMWLRFCLNYDKIFE